MSNQSSAIVQRLWNYCTVRRDDGLSYGDYVEQLTYLLFLKMDNEWRKIGISINLTPTECLYQSILHRVFTDQLVLQRATDSQASVATIRSISTK